MLFHVGGDVEVARRRAHGARIAFARNAQPRTALRAGRDADFHHLRVRQPAVAVAGRAGVLQPALCRCSAGK